MKTEIITIGDEILIGQITDTNSAWMATELNKIGFYIHQITSVSDMHDHILVSLSDASKRAELVLITGGLGPTKDDITKKVLCDFFSTHLVENKDVLSDINTFVERRGHVLSEQNRKQAEVPENCTVLRNPIGTAPGLWFEKGGVIFVSMPGVPFEMMELMTNQIIPLLKEKFGNKNKHIIHQTICTTGVPESALAQQLEQWQENLHTAIKVAYLPTPGNNKIRLSLEGDNFEELQSFKNQAIVDLSKELKEVIFSTNGEDIEVVVGKLLIENQCTVSTAESCSGGNIAHLITSVAGSSQYFEGSVVAYSNRIKSKILGVNAKDIEKHGAVSEEVVLQMADGVRKLYNTTYGVATSGIAGPGGGSPEKPVGTVWVAVSSPKETVAMKFLFGNSRERNIIRSSIAALNMLRLRLE